MTDHGKLNINAERLHASIEEMARIGATPGGGVTRLALSDEDRAARDLFRQWMESAGLSVRIDDLGNMIGRREGSGDELPVLTGSHLDSVRKGGKWDGAVGVLGGLEVIRTLNDQGITTTRPIELVNFTNEEGARFEPAMMSSGTLAGAFDLDYVYSRADPDGITFGDSLVAIGYQGDTANRPSPAVAFLELHNEQNPFLEDAGVPVGVVEGVQGITWWEASIEGASDHGSSPMSNRRDALVAASEVIASLPELVGEFDASARATVGRLALEPDIINVIPARAVFSVDIRHSELAILEKVVDAIRAKLDDVAKRRAVGVTFERIWLSEPTPFDANVVDTVEQACADAGVDGMRLWSGAGHDAKYMQEICPTGMIFVRSLNGISHSEDEYSAPDDVAAGVNVLLHSVLRLAGR